MQITIISDTHGHHQKLTLPPTTDMIIHAGDFSNAGRLQEVQFFLKWYAALPHRYKLLIGGNHDFLLEQAPKVFQSLLPDNIIYLEDEAIEIEGLQFWGSLITPFFFNWAFNRHRGTPIRKYWEKIPNDIDVLITHGPPKGFGDVTVRGEVVGCEDLLEKVLEVKPRYHIYGHIHESYGIISTEHTTFINASNMDEKYRMVNEAVVLNIE